MNISANVLVCLRSLAVFVDDFGDVLAGPPVWVSVCAGMWRVCGACGVVRCAALGIPRGMVVQFLFLLLFALAFWAGLGCDFGGRGRLGWCCVWGELQAFKFGRVVKNGTLIYKGLTVT